MPTRDELLRELRRRVQLPAAEHAALLREVRGDLEGMVALLELQGHARAEARARALAALAPSEEALAALAQVHRPLYRRLTAGVAQGRLRLAEVSAVVAMAVLAALAPVVPLVQGGRLPPLPAGTLSVCAGLLLANMGWYAFRGFVRRDADVEDLERGGRTQAGLVGLALSAGSLALAVHVWQVAGAWQRGPGSSGPEALRLVAEASTATAFMLGVAILGVFGALALLQGIMVARDIERELGELVESLNPREGRR